MRAQSRAVSGMRATVRTLGTLSRRSADMPVPLPRLADRPGGQVVAVGPSHLGPDDVARPEVLALHPYEAVDLRGVGVAAGQVVVRHLGVRAVDDGLDLAAH